eukprot:10305169-Prorocentrum_lima.AAC.1
MNAHCVALLMGRRHVQRQINTVKRSEVTATKTRILQRAGNNEKQRNGPKQLIRTALRFMAESCQ